jgi:hypothetical protein
LGDEQDVFPQWPQEALNLSLNRSNSVPTVKAPVFAQSLWNLCRPAKFVVLHNHVSLITAPFGSSGPFAFYRVLGVGATLLSMRSRRNTKN